MSNDSAAFWGMVLGITAFLALVGIGAILAQVMP